MNILKMMEESCKVIIVVDGQLYFEETFANNEVASKFVADWIFDKEFRIGVKPFSEEFEIPDHFYEEFASKEDVFNKVVEASHFEVAANVKYEIIKENSYIVVGYENSNHEMVFG